MITLNLVSDDLKKEIQRRKLYSMLIGMMYFLIFITIIFSAVFFYTKTIIDVKMHNIVNQSNAINNSNQILISKISNINSLITFTDKIQGDYVPWTCFIGKIIAGNNGIKFFSFSIDKKNLKFKVRGNALTRDDLLAYQKNLEGSGILTDISLPFNSLLSKEDIDFEISAKINAQSLSKLK